MSGNLLVRREGRLLRLTLNRLEKRNALSTELCQTIVKAVEEAQEDRTVGAILLDAAGPAFCAGMDLDESVLPDAAGRTAIHESLFTLGFRSHKPLVAAVQGAALAGGTGLAANAHVVFATEDARFGLTEIRIGMWPFVISRAMVAAVGERRALELSLTGRVFGAREAMQYGLVHFVAAPVDLNERATEAATAIANASPEAVTRGMTYFAEGRELPPAARGELAARLRARLFQSPDYREGVRAFREKRTPRWPSLE